MQPINNSNNQVSLKPDPSNQPSSITDRLVQAFGRVWQSIKTVSHRLYAMVFRVNEVGTDVLNKIEPSVKIQNSKEEASVLTSPLESSLPTPSEIKPPLEGSEVTPGEYFDSIDWNYFDLINVEAQGDCQILAFMAGLEDMHSSLLKKADGTKYTPEEIRKLEIDFIRKKMNREEAPNYKGEVTNNNQEDYLTAIEAGFWEHNDAAKAEMAAAISEDFTENNEITNKKQELQCEKYTYEFLLADKDTSESVVAEYKSKLEKINEELKNLEDFEKPVFDRPPLEVFDNTDEYLNYLSQPKSYCSNANLMALSEFFNVPIYLHVRSNNKDQPIQMFNLSQSDLDPIHLHFSTSEKHYQLRLNSDQA